MRSKKEIQKVQPKNLENIKKRSTIVSRGLSDLGALSPTQSERSYMIGEFVGTGEPYYGTVKECKMLVNRNGKWEISLLLACGEGFTDDTVEVDEETFTKTMLSLGVSKEKIAEFIIYKTNEIDWENF